MSETTPELQTSLLQRLRSVVSAECFETWFRELTLRSIEGQNVCLLAPNRHVKAWIDAHYKQELLRAALEIFPGVTGVQITVAPTAADSAVTLGSVLERALPAMQPREVLSNGALQHSDRPRDTVRLTALSPKWRLEQFVVGKSNRVPYSAAQTVVESPGTVFNPLWLHGTHGIGKTHLLHGIAHGLTERKLNVLHISCEEFANAYISAIQNKRVDIFRARFRSCDALLVDDVQFLSGRDRTQEEFLHTFDSLSNAHKQIVLCANAIPREIPKLDQKLATRFQHGLVAHLSPPDEMLRMAVLKHKAEARGLTLSEEVAQLFATHINGSVPQLEGALCKLIALAAAESVTPQHADVSVAAKHDGKSFLDRRLAIVALRELGYLRSGPVTLQDILEAVSKHYGISIDDIRSAKRYAPLMRPRHVGMYLSRELTEQGVAEIGRFYGNRDHATVLFAWRKILDQRSRDENLDRDIKTLRQLLGE
ncbi:MAG TPA: chromosomal replication initiator protein DnaA [Planctomycetota bacterium]